MKYGYRNTPLVSDLHPQRLLESVLEMFFIHNTATYMHVTWSSLMSVFFTSSSNDHMIYTWKIRGWCVVTQSIKWKQVHNYFERLSVFKLTTNPAFMKWNGLCSRMFHFQALKQNQRKFHILKWNRTSVDIVIVWLPASCFISNISVSVVSSKHLRLKLF